MQAFEPPQRTCQPPPSPADPASHFFCFSTFAALRLDADVTSAWVSRVSIVNRIITKTNFRQTNYNASLVRPGVFNNALAAPVGLPCNIRTASHMHTRTRGLPRRPSFIGPFFFHALFLSPFFLLFSSQHSSKPFLHFFFRVFFRPSAAIYAEAAPDLSPHVVRTRYVECPKRPTRHHHSQAADIDRS